MWRWVRTKALKKKTLDGYSHKQLSAFQCSAIKAACVDTWEPSRQGLEKWRPEFRTVHCKFIILHMRLAQGQFLVPS